MAQKRPKGDPGTVVVLEHVSQILKGNPLRLVTHLDVNSADIDSAIGAFAEFASGKCQ